MRPHEHYIEAETLLERAKAHRPSPSSPKQYVQNTLDAAKVHAALARVPTPPPELDYKALLQKYIEHVGGCEGTDFLGEHHRHRGDVKFTDKEWQALREE